MRFLSAASSLVACTFLVACAGVRPQTLDTPTGKHPLVLAESIVYSDHENSYKYFTRDFVLLAGRYEPVRQDRDGTYYQGPLGCLFDQLVGDGKGHRYTDDEKRKWPNPAKAFNVWRHDCGVYVPDDIRKAVTVYTVVNSQFKNDQVLPRSDDSVPLAMTVVGITTTQPMLASPYAVGAAAGVGTVVVMGILEAESGNFVVPYAQPRAVDLRSKLKAASPGSP